MQDDMVDALGVILPHLDEDIRPVEGAVGHTGDCFHGKDVFAHQVFKSGTRTQAITLGSVIALDHIDIFLNGRADVRLNLYTEAIARAMFPGPFADCTIMLGGIKVIQMCIRDSYKPYVYDIRSHKGEFLYH